ncbi:MAG: metalloregulator ArsR/SmtB family transcription factor [Sandaracinaceae bacterium]|nr:metalloregulator ArsR/SmtB family transcription factor [Sandaracinaceae bacterium]MDW8247572.1 metalloregulator ArsR/SmtB family transcription factor [Sandaracinaceae bacterium]
MFQALGDEARLTLAWILSKGERCVGDLAEITSTPVSTISQRLRVLHQSRIVKRRKEGKHVYYSLHDAHIESLIISAFSHVEEKGASTSRRKT